MPATNTNPHPTLIAALERDFSKQIFAPGDDAASRAHSTTPSGVPATASASHADPGLKFMDSRTLMSTVLSSHGWSRTSWSRISRW